jgi:hypothetical protein
MEAWRQKRLEAQRLIKIVDSPERPMLLVNVRNFNVSMEFIRNNPNKYGVRFAFCDGALPEDLWSEWNRTRGIKRVDACTAPLAVEDFYDRPEMEYIGVVLESKSLDFANVPNLNELSLPWPKKYLNIESLRELEWLSIQRNFYKYGNSIGDLAPLSKLRKLLLNDQAMVSVDGVDKIPSLTDLTVFSGRKLGNLEAINRTGIRSLNIRHSHHIDLDTLGGAVNLEKIFFYGCRLKSLSFARSLRQLKSLTLMACDVEDSDLSAVNDLYPYALEEFGIAPPRRRYAPNAHFLYDLIYEKNGDRNRRNTQIERMANIAKDEIMHRMTCEANREMGLVSGAIGEDLLNAV